MLASQWNDKSDRSGTVSRNRFWAILRQQCPLCRRGRIFRSMLAMHECCPVCGLRFRREPGYFLGAMYISYPLSAMMLGLAMLGAHFLFPSWEFQSLLLLAVAVYLPWMPLVFRYSRVLWIHFDRWAWLTD